MDIWMFIPPSILLPLGPWISWQITKAAPLSGPTAAPARSHPEAACGRERSHSLGPVHRLRWGRHEGPSGHWRCWRQTPEMEATPVRSLDGLQGKIPSFEMDEMDDDWGYPVMTSRKPPSPDWSACRQKWLYNMRRLPQLFKITTAHHCQTCFVIQFSIVNQR